MVGRRGSCSNVCDCRGDSSQSPAPQENYGTLDSSGAFLKAIFGLVNVLCVVQEYEGGGG